MPSTRDIRRRIRSVKNIQQITKAMEMVAAARLRRAQERANNSRPYTEKIREVLSHVAGHVPDAVHPLLAVRPVQRVAYLVLSADKGLAGAYSSNIIKEVLMRLEGQRDVSLLIVGRKARDYFRRRGYRVDREWTGFSEKPTFAHARELAQAVATAYTEGVYDEVYLVYTQFYSPIKHHPVTVRLLPVATLVEGGAAASEYIFEPSAAAVLDLLLPRYLETMVYGGLLQAAASELGARMTAMGSATDNAEELISQLVLHYNKVRQATITREITEIVGGAEALQ